MDYKESAKGQATTYPSRVLYNESGVYSFHCEDYGLIESSNFVCIAGEPTPTKYGSSVEGYEFHNFLASLSHGRDVVGRDGVVLAKSGSTAFSGLVKVAA